MGYRVVYRGQTIGRSRLERRDSAMGVAFGQFYPLPGYESVRWVFVLFTQAQDASGRIADADALARYYEARDALSLALQTPDGHAIAMEALHIVDWGDTDADVPLEMVVVTADPVFWKAR
jgi:hypothetical protein